jgi:hypothetical protein
LRVHPALGRSGRRLVEKELSHQTKVVISTYETGQDLLNSRFVLFRSSAIGIEALSFGVIPIHYNEEGGNLLNPILDCNLDFPEFSSANQILNFLMTFDPKQYQGEIFYKECYRFFNEYFGKLKNINFVVH